MNKAAHHFPFENERKDVSFLVDGRNLNNDGQCFSTKESWILLIDLGQILSIHHITTYFKDTSRSVDIGIYNPIFFIVPYFYSMLLFFARYIV